MIRAGLTNRAIPSATLEQRFDAIDRATPEWVRVCRAKNHNVVVMSAIRQPDGYYAIDWFCSTCGKDRK